MFFAGKSTQTRKVAINRKTAEVDITGELVVDGAGKASIKTPFEPLNHILTLFCFHGLFDITLSANGDLKHHIIEDLGIALGKAFKEALGDKAGINRYGCFTLVMDETVVAANIDISGRPCLCGIGSVKLGGFSGTFDDSNFTTEHAEEFLKAFIQHAGISLAYEIKTAEGDVHHVLEALFKAFGKALDQATQIDPRRKGVPSTKGIID